LAGNISIAAALHACLAEHGLRLAHYERGRGILAGLMGDCAAIARLNR